MVGFGVSTHSRLKAAGFNGNGGLAVEGGFNTQPPEGGWGLGEYTVIHGIEFQHTAA